MLKYVLFVFFSISILLPDDKLYVDEIKIKNNIIISDIELIEVLILKKPTLFDRSEYTPKIFDHDIQNLIGYYKTNGFLDVKVEGEYKKIFNQYISIIYDIDEGTQYQFDKIITSGNKSMNNKNINNYFIHGIGRFYNPMYISNQLIELKKEYLRNGMLNVYIQEEMIIDESNITLRINISEGIQYIINNIHISGLKSVKKKYLDREIIFKTNEIYNVDKIDLTRKWIFDWGIFSSVEIFPERLNEIKGLVDIHIKIRELKASSIEADIGFSELSSLQDPLLTPGFDLGSRWVIGNLMDTPSKLIIRNSIATEIDLQSLINNDNLKQIHTKFIYKSPWTLTFRVPTEVTLFYRVDNDSYENLIAYGFSHLIYFKKNHYTRYDISSNYKIINAKYQYSSEDTEPVRSMEFIYTTNKINDIISPKGGYYLRMSSSIYGTFLGGERNFFQINNEFRKYFSIKDRNIIALRYKMGFIYNINSNYLPSYYKYELGGQSSLRGWKNKEQFWEAEMGMDYIDAGSLIYELVNLEYRFHIFKQWGGELFIDLGRLYNEMSEFIEAQISYNYGAGITYDTAFGPIRIEYAIPYTNSNYYDENIPISNNIETGQIHVSLLYMY